MSALYRQPRWLRMLTGDRLTWAKLTRPINPKAPLHPSVIERLSAAAVPQMGTVKPYRPEALRKHEVAGKYLLDRKSVGQGRSGHVRVDLGGGRIIKKKKKKYIN